MRVTAAARGGHNGLGAVLFSGFHHLVRDDIDRFIPADAFPFVFAAFADTDHRVLVAVRMVKRVDAGKAFGAERAFAHRIVRIAFDFDNPSVANMRADTAVMDTGSACRRDDLSVIFLIGVLLRRTFACGKSF